MSTSTTGRARTAAIVAAIAGTLAIAAALVTPFLPVTAHTASIDWPTGQRLAPGNASIVSPLATQTPAALDINVPCRALVTDSPGTVMATMPAASKEYRDNALTVSTTESGATVTVRGAELATADRGALNNCRSLRIWNDGVVMHAQFIGAGPVLSKEGAERPQVAGIFTDLDASSVSAARAAGLAVHIDIDNRFDLAPSALKWAVLILGTIAFIAALAAAYLIDNLRGYRRKLAGRLRFPRPNIADGLVALALVGWHFLGAGSSDDGYILTMGRIAPDAGYFGDYYRWFNVPEAPFDWYYAFLGHWSEISTAGMWMRLPALAAGIASWLLLSHVLLPRLGHAIGKSQWARLTAAAVFVGFWLPFASGLRSEAIIVLGTLVTWAMVERAVATRQVLPAALAALAAGLTLATAPHGLIAVAVLIAGSRPILRAIRARRGELGLLPLIAPVGAALAMVILVVFRQQTAATVAEAIRLRYAVGPTASWYQELLRYYFLTLSHDDGALARRLPVLLVILALAATLAVLLRRKHIPGIARGPLWRLVAAVLLTVLLLSFTPTKWTVQFGVYAGLGSALAAVVTVIMTQQAARSARDLWVYLAALMLACAGASAGSNAWGWGYDFGISWSDKIPALAGTPLPTIFLVLTGIALLATIWCHVRPATHATPGGATPAAASEPTARWRIVVNSAPMLVIIVAMLLAELALFSRAAISRSETYTTFSSNMHALAGNTCAMADQVLVEPDSNAGMLTPIGTTNVSRALAGTSHGFTADGVAADLKPETIVIGAGTIHTGRKVSSSFVVSAGTPGTTGGRGPTTINGSTVALPFGLDPDRTPVLGSYGYDDGTAELTSSWYRLPNRDASPLLVISAAGSIFSIDEDNAARPGRSLIVEFGRENGTEFQKVGQAVPIDPDWGYNRPWRNLRVPMSAVPGGATAMRIVATDSNVNPDEWLAITPPRAPRLRTLDEVVGHDDPVLLDLSVGSQFPCQRPMAIRDGVFEVPKWRIAPDQITAGSKSVSWQDGGAGGVLGITDATAKSSTMSTYLKNDWYRDWGALIALTPLAPQAQPAQVTRGTRTDWGWTRRGPVGTVTSND